MTAVRAARRRRGRRDRRPARRRGLRPHGRRASSTSRARSPHGDVLVAERRRRRRRRRVLRELRRDRLDRRARRAPARRAGAASAQALTEAACARLRERGARTVLLFATDMGRPLYERMGFVPEGGATAWRGSAGDARRAAVQLRPLRERDRPALRDVDRARDRRAARRVLDALAPAVRRGWPSATARWRGWALARHGAPASAICADDPEAGVALLAAAAGGARRRRSSSSPTPTRRPPTPCARWALPAGQRAASACASGRRSTGTPSASSACSTSSGADRKSRSPAALWLSMQDGRPRNPER